MSPNEIQTRQRLCYEFEIQELVDFCQGLLPEPRMEAVLGHLPDCPRCEAEVSRQIAATDLEAAPRPLLDEQAARDFESFRMRLKRPTAPGGSYEAGDHLGHFEVVRKVGKGGFSTVYECLDQRMGRHVAVKLLDPRHFEGSHLVRLEREARMLAALDHPGIVKAFEIWPYHYPPCIVMEFVAGGSIDKALSHRPLPPQEAARLAASVARALQHAHDNGILHRDLKPSNLLVVQPVNPEEPLPEDISLKVSDFGLARPFGDDSRLTSTDCIVGTPAYMSPEQASGDRSTIGPAADIYSIGVVLYEFLIGRPPLVAENAVLTLRLIDTIEPVPPRAVRPEIPRDLETICLKCLRKVPAERYASAASLAEDLERFLEKKPIRARPLPAPVRAWRWCLRNRRLSAAIAVAGLALAGLAAGGVIFALTQAQLVKIANENGLLAVEQARRAAASQKQALAERDQSRLLFVASSRVLHTIGNMLAMYKFSNAADVDLKLLNTEFQKQVLTLSELYLKRPDLDTDSPELLPMSLFNAARAYEELGNDDEALRHYESMLKLTGGTQPVTGATETYRHLATAACLAVSELHKRHGRLKGAIAAIEPFWLRPIDPATKRPPPPNDPSWEQLRGLFGAKLRELYNLSGKPEKARQIDEELERPRPRVPAAPAGGTER